ncbi:GtrA family protein [Ralstonia pickettii]|uniref:GtrA family protein n=1 Tax=Ralstonia pickettii TaxID=329 RepID=UPI0027152F7C|nr:GtrA family protein [Ralstonia pickettii]WKZ85930.1 GtrA family protein [Ralstonia pickettii]
MGIDGEVLQRTLRQFMRFAGVSGACWILDFAILLALTGWVGIGPLLGNIVSSTIAAATAFLITAHVVFNRNNGLMHRKLAFYLVYNGCMILVASWVMKELVTWLVAMLTRGEAIVAAKIAITPVVMLCNFAVSKTATERLSL